MQKELRKKLDNKDSQLTQLQIDLDNLRDENDSSSTRIEMLEPVAELAVHPSRRFLNSGTANERYSYDIIRAGNRAVHDGNMVVDVALFALDLMPSSDRGLFAARCDEVDIESLVGRETPLELLWESPLLTRLLDMHASLNMEMKGGLKYSSDLHKPKTRFEALEYECHILLGLGAT